eukprot:14818373-Alexandrium_andersonii.AAC.1
MAMAMLMAMVVAMVTVVKAVFMQMSVATQWRGYGCGYDKATTIATKAKHGYGEISILVTM